ncbi:unnamed protein product, partial [Anisakis simplex]|uniref:Secreted protein n=1 Tax=Anisakis simplex TaxID=6269 RepID=A0A0M3K8F5_ANISI
MRQFVLRIFFVLRQLLNPCLGPIAINREDADVEAERTALRSSVSADPAALQTGDSTDDESSAVRLSRRSSVLVSLLSPSQN